LKELIHSRNSFSSSKNLERSPKNC